MGVPGYGVEVFSIAGGAVAGLLAGRGVPEELLPGALAAGMALGVLVAVLARLAGRGGGSRG